ncbi:MAG: N-acetylneuraminate synthase family protein [Myxococcota bacterium]
MLIVAEIGMNHDGNFDVAYELVRQAKLAGADIAKFQFGWRYTEGEINHITPELARRLKEWCAFLGVEFMTSIINDDALELARELSPDRYKIASRTVIENPALVEKVLSEDKETFISLGWWKEDGWPFGPPSEKLRYIHCISKYPTYPGDLVGFPERFGPDGLYGYSDHTHGIDTCLFAASRGAQFIEKHFTLNKTSKAVHNDHVLSATPDEMAQLSQRGRMLERINAIVTGRDAGIQGKP